jgi:hypothetical protein
VVGPDGVRGWGGGVFPVRGAADGVGRGVGQRAEEGLGVGEGEGAEEEEAMGTREVGSGRGAR